MIAYEWVKKAFEEIWEGLKFVVMIVLCKFRLHLGKKFVFTQTQTYGEIDYYSCPVCGKTPVKLRMHR